ncbi:hypothetical protein PISMIDRAFT_686600, partial [Pisolithus microcarpus 441]
EERGWKVINTEEEDTARLYPLTNSVIVPRPIAFVKDTPTNVRNGFGFAINIISEPFVKNANVASINAPSKFDEWTINGLTKAPSIHVKAPRVKESAFNMECELFQAIDITLPVSGQITTTMILAYIKYIHVHNNVLNERGVVDITKYKPIARLGDISYGRVGDVFRLARPVWDREKERIESVL